jgi:hypothetical protein
MSIGGGSGLRPGNTILIERHETSMRRKREMIGKLGKMNLPNDLNGLRWM